MDQSINMKKFRVQTSREGFVHWMVPSVFLSASIFQVICANKGLTLGVECKSYPRSRSETVLYSCHHLFLQSVLNHLCGSVWGYLLNPSDKLRSKFWIHRPFGLVFWPPQEFPWLFIATCHLCLKQLESLTYAATAHHL